MADASSLKNVLSRMVHQSFWIPSRDLLTNGVCLTRMIAQAVLILNDMVSIIQVG